MATAPRMTPGQRRGLYAKIHIGRKQIGLDDETWRDLLETKYGKSSSADLTGVELIKLVDHLAAQGAQFTSSTEPRNKPGYQAKAASRRSDWYEIPDGPQAGSLRYIAAMWRELGYDMTALDTRVRREFKVEALRWLAREQDIRRLVADLEQRVEAKRRSAGAAV